MSAVRRAARDGARGLRRFVRAFTGEAKWDEYLDECRRTGADPVSRREFERHRAEHLEVSARSRCC